MLAANTDGHHGVQVVCRLEESLPSADLKLYKKIVHFPHSGSRFCLV